MHSGRLFQESKQNVRQVVSDLLKIGQEKSSLQQLCMNALIQIIAQVRRTFLHFTVILIFDLMLARFNVLSTASQTSRSFGLAKNKLINK